MAFDVDWIVWAISNSNAPVTAAEFRELALSLPQTFEASHLAHPDFRVKGGKIFATLGYPDDDFGVLVLTPNQQQEMMGRYPEMFVPVRGGWGKRGSTQVVLRSASRPVIESAMECAWRKAAPKKVADRFAK